MFVKQCFMTWPNIQTCFMSLARSILKTTATFTTATTTKTAKTTPTTTTTTTAPATTTTTTPTSTTTTTPTSSTTTTTTTPTKTTTTTTTTIRLLLSSLHFMTKELISEMKSQALPLMVICPSAFARSQPSSRYTT